MLDQINSLTHKLLNQTTRFLTKEYAGTVEVTSRVMDAISIVFSAYIIFRFFDISVDGTIYLPLLVLIKILFCFIILRRVNFIEVGEVDHTQTNSVD